MDKIIPTLSEYMDTVYLPLIEPERLNQTEEEREESAQDTLNQVRLTKNQAK